MNVGDAIAHYRVLGRLGQGGMGVVYRALDTRLDRVVALKVLPPGSVSDTERLRFQREAKAASALNHPNIVTIYDFDQAGEISYIAMELVEGRSLHEILTHGPLRFDELLPIARQSANALVRAHAAGIIHRDLKPGNLMVTGDGLLKVLDFGLAKRSNEPTADAATLVALTGVGTTLGTPAYMSPEQARGEVADHRADIFSFGVVLYEMVTGKRPFQGEHGFEVMNAVANQDPAPSVSLRPEIPAALHHLISRCLEKNKERRVQTMSEVSTRLESLTQSLQSAAAQATVVSAPLPSALAPPPPRPRRRIPWRILAPLAAISLAALVLFLVNGGGTRTASTPPAQPKTAFEFFRLGSSLSLNWDRAGNLVRAIESLQKAISLDPRHAPSYAQLAIAYCQQNVTSPDRQWLRSARDAALQALKLNPDLALSHVAMARVLIAENNIGDAQAELNRALALDPRMSEAQRWLGYIHSSRKDAPAAEKAFLAALSMDPADWRNSHELGAFLYKQARYAESAAVLRKATAGSSGNHVLHRTLAAALHMNGDYEEAASEFQRALEIQPSAAVYNNLGTLRFFQGRYADALPAFEKAVDMNPGSYMYWGNLGDAYRWAPGMRGKAPAAYARAIQLARAQMKDRQDQSEFRSRLALYLAKLGDPAAARAELAQLASANRPAVEHFREAITWELIGDRDKALASLQRAVRGGYSDLEIQNEPELVSLRADRRYHLMMASGQNKNK